MSQHFQWNRQIHGALVPVRVFWQKTHGAVWFVVGLLVTSARALATLVRWWRQMGRRPRRPRKCLSNWVKSRAQLCLPGVTVILGKKTYQRAAHLRVVQEVLRCDGSIAARAMDWVAVRDTRLGSHVWLLYQVPFVVLHHWNRRQRWPNAVRWCRYQSHLHAHQHGQEAHCGPHRGLGGDTVVFHVLGWGDLCACQVAAEIEEEDWRWFSRL